LEPTFSLELNPQRYEGCVPPGAYFAGE
jgi:hypothetical protein